MRHFQLVDSCLMGPEGNYAIVLPMNQVMAAECDFSCILWSWELKSNNNSIRIGSEFQLLE